MMRENRTFLKLAMVTFLLMVGAPAFGKGPAPSGKISVSSTSIAAGIGVSWGNGVLKFKGKTYQFSVDGLSLIDLGITKASAVGNVYDLTDVSKFPGTYVAAEAGIALAGGMGGMVLRNQNGVVIQLRSVSQGAKLQLGPGGLSIKLNE